MIVYLMDFRWITVVILEPIHAKCLLDIAPVGTTINPYHIGRYGASFKFLPYQLSMVVYWTTMAVTGNGELGFDSGEGA